jgi:hypothetical protein
MGILSKGLTKLLKPDPDNFIQKREAKKPSLSGKVTNPITKPRVYTQKAQVRDAMYETAHEFEYSDLDSDELYDLTAKERQEAPIPRKIGEFYSPVKDTIEQMPIAKEGSTGQTIEAFINKRSPNVTKSELANAQIKLDPNKKYLREEVLALQDIPEGYDIRVRELREKNTIFHKTQRQRVLDAPRNYFEVTVHAPRLDSDVEDIIKDHFPIGVVAHVRASRRQGEDGKDYILVEEIQSDAARASGITEPAEDVFYNPDVNFELANELDTFMDDILLNEEDVEGITKYKLKTDRYTDDPNFDVEEITENLENDIMSYSMSTTNPYNYIAKNFYEEVHQRFNTPNFEFDSMMLAYDNTNYGNIREADKALDLDIQGEDIPSTYRLSQIKIAENLIEEYKRGYKSLKNDPKFDVENFIDKTDKQNQKLVEDGIRKIHAYAIENDARSHILGLPYDLDMLYSVLEYKGDTGTGRLEGVNAQAIEQKLKKIEENLYTKNPFNDPQPPGPEEPIFEKYKTPVTTKTETMLKGLKASIALAKEQGLDKIVIPSYRMIGRERGNEEGFKDLYDKAFKKAINVLQKESKGTIKLNTIKLKHAKPDEDVSSYLDEMPHYGGADFDEDFASELDISNFEFDPEKQTFRFSKGGTLMDGQMELFNEGGLRDEGGQVEPESGNKVPSGSLKEEVADDIPVMMSEGEFVFPADVVRFIGLNTLMKMRQDAKQGLKTMEEMGQMGNSEEATIPDDMPFEMADLIVVSGDKPKKMQSGGLLDDPRFQRPTGGGGDTPTITDEDKKQMEDALLRTGYGNVVMKRYVNADGDVKYIPFIDGEPQMEIPEGYELDESAPKQQTSIGGGSDSGGGGDSGGPASLAPAFGDGQTFQKPKIMVDGVEYENIEKMDSETLLKYYEQFNSPIYRYAATFATLFFSPLVGGAIAIGQSFSNKNSPNGLNAVQQKLMTMKLTPEQRKRAKKVFDDIAKKGSGGLSAITKGVTNFLGLTSDKEKGEKETDFEKFLRTGNVKGANNELNNAINKSPENKKIFENANREGLQKYITEGGMGMDIDKRKPFAEPQPSGLPTELGEQEFGFADPVTQTDTAPVDTTPATVEQTEPVSALQTKIDPVTGEVTEGDPFAPIERAKPAGTELGSEAGAEVPPVEEDRSKKRLTTGEQDLLSIQKDLRALEARNKREADTLKKKLSSMGTDYGEKRVQQDVDRDGGDSSSSIDDFFGSDFGQPSQPTYVSQTAKAAGSAKTGLGASASRPQTLGVPAPAPTYTSPSYSELTGNPFGRSKGGLTKMYVGGVPTKPMKPQRLKKGGLAKSKVKPKRMKKGGLASRKK